MISISNLFTISSSGSLRLVAHFVRHVVIGTFLFVILGIAAILLNLFNDLLPVMKMPQEIVNATKYLEIFVFCIDACSYVFFVISEAYALVREIAREQYNATVQSAGQKNNKSDIPGVNSVGTSTQPAP